MRNKRLVVSVLGAAGLGLIGLGHVQAGYKTEDVANTVNMGSYSYGKGSMGTARASADGYQQVGCSLESSTGGLFVRCKARSATGAYLECTTSSASIVQAAGSIGSASRLYFTVSNSAPGTCTSLHVTNTSDFRPMVP